MRFIKKIRLLNNLDSIKVLKKREYSTGPDEYSLLMLLISLFSRNIYTRIKSASL